MTRKLRKQEGAMAATAAESLAAIRDVQALSLEKNFADVFFKVFSPRALTFRFLLNRALWK